MESLIVFSAFYVVEREGEGGKEREEGEVGKEREREMREREHEI